MVGAKGFEPSTLWSQTRCATRLRYAPTAVILPVAIFAQARLAGKAKRNATCKHLPLQRWIQTAS